MSIWSRLIRALLRKPSKPYVPPTYTVKVRVQTTDGQPVVGAEVVWDGTERGSAVTNEQGEFTLPPRTAQGFNIDVYGPPTDEAVGRWSTEWVGVNLTENMNYVLIIEFTPAPPPPVIPPKPAGRTGVPLIVRRTFADGDGKYLAFGTSLFWFLWGFRYDRERLAKNLQYLSDEGVDYIRALVLVGGESWADRAGTVDLISLIGEATDWLYGTFGMRVQWTIFGGIEETPTPALRKFVVQQVAAQLLGRADKVQLVEVANEGWKNGFPGESGNAELKDLTKVLKQEGVLNVVATTTPQGINPDEARKMYDGSAAALVTLHLDRDIKGTGGRWRPQRQAREGQGIGLPWVNNEPIGPRSSVEMDDDPERMSVGAALTWLCQGAAHVYHTGAGVRGGGLWDVNPPGGAFWAPRPANVWEVANIKETLSAVRAVRKLLPADLPNWQWWNGNRAAGAGHPFDGAVLQDNDQFLLRAFAATNGDEFVVIPIDIKRNVPFVARKAMTFSVYNWKGEFEQGVTLEAGQAFMLLARGSAYIIGRNL